MVYKWKYKKWVEHSSAGQMAGIKVQYTNIQHDLNYDPQRSEILKEIKRAWCQS